MLAGGRAAPRLRSVLRGASVAAERAEAVAVLSSCLSVAFWSSIALWVLIS